MCCRQLAYHSRGTGRINENAHVYMYIKVIRTSVCVCVYCIYAHTYSSPIANTCMHTQTHTCIRKHMHAYMDTYMHTYLSANIYTFREDAYQSIYKHIHALRKHTHAHINTYMHT